MATLAYRIVNDELVLFVSGREDPGELEWREYTRSVDGLVGRARGTGRMIKFLVFADEGGPNAKQRAAIVDLLHGIPTRTAVVSASMIARNLITAFGWLNFSIKGFAPTGLADAMAYLELSGEQRAGLLGWARELAPRVGGVRCVELAAGTGTDSTRWQ